eukprot:gene56342-43153_t
MSDKTRYTQFRASIASGKEGPDRIFCAWAGGGLTARATRSAWSQGWHYGLGMWLVCPGSAGALWYGKDSGERVADLRDLRADPTGYELRGTEECEQPGFGFHVVMDGGAAGMRPAFVKTNPVSVEAQGRKGQRAVLDITVRARAAWLTDHLGAFRGAVASAVGLRSEAAVTECPDAGGTNCRDVTRRVIGSRRALAAQGT